MAGSAPNECPACSATRESRGSKPAVESAVGAGEREWTQHVVCAGAGRLGACATAAQRGSTAPGRAAAPASGSLRAVRAPNGRLGLWGGHARVAHQARLTCVLAGAPGLKTTPWSGAGGQESSALRHQCAKGLQATSGRGGQHAHSSPALQPNGLKLGRRDPDETENETVRFKLKNFPSTSRANPQPADFDRRAGRFWS